MTDTPSEPVAECFIDDESAGLRHLDDVWETALIRVSPAGNVTQYVWQIIDFDPSAADPKALEFGGFYDRHPMHLILDPEDPLRREPTDEERMMHPALAVHGPNLDMPVQHALCSRAVFADQFERLIRGAVVWACNPCYDVPKLTQSLAHEDLMGFQRRQFSAHYRPLCATTFAAATALAQGVDVGPFPWVNAEVGKALGVNREGYGRAHSGLADAHYAKALVDAARARQAQART